MQEYLKIPNIYERETFGKNRLIDGKFSSETLELLRNIQWRWTEKVDGTNIRVHWDGHRVEFAGRTDRAQIPKPLYDLLTELFGGTNKEEIFEQTFNEKDVILFGEGYGGRIQGAGPKYGELRFILFDVTVNGKYLSRENVEGIAGVFGLDCVPEIGYGTLEDAVKIVKRRPKSLLGNIDMEGLVCRPMKELQDENGRRVICKIKARDF